MADGVVCCLGVSMPVGVSKIPLDSYGKPLEGNELPCPDRASPVLWIEFECGVVGLQEDVLQNGPICDESTLKNLRSADVGLSLDQCFKVGSAPPCRCWKAGFRPGTS